MGETDSQRSRFLIQQDFKGIKPALQRGFRARFQRFASGGKAILKLLQEMCREKGMTVIVITHNSALAPMADRLIKIKNGKVSSMKVNENPISIDEIEW